MKKKLLVTTAALSLSLTSLAPVTSLAATQNYTHAEEDRIKVSNEIVDLDEIIKKLNVLYFDRFLSWKIENGYRAVKLNHSRLDVERLDVKDQGVKDLTVNNLEPLYIGGNTFENNTSVTQTYKSAEYSRTVSQEVITQTNKGFKVNKSLSFLKIPIILPDGVKLVGDLDYTNNVQQTKKTEETLTAPAQDVVVPPNKVYKVEVKLIKKSFHGEVAFSGTGVNPKSILNIYYSWQGAGGRPPKNEDRTFNSRDMYDKLPLHEQQQIKGITFGNGNNFSVSGNAMVNGVYGSEMEVKTFDITDKNNIKLVDVKYYR
ncbi:ETX/MTX2 family pore-forming toxin [Bacillus cereus]|nr:ETX/MTX2 family pore-forming toxin [Bacillus cereus]MEB8666309.1 ETX/MTX2 family pore-forming toxin [Bacillus cereus]